MIESIEKIPEFDDHKMFQYVYDSKSGLSGFIAIHRGGTNKPAFGATRLWHYTSELDALRDALNLSKMMSYKSAMAGLPYGGGKGVIIAPKKIKNRSALLESYAEKVCNLAGHFITGTDVGLTQSDVKIMKRHCPYMVGLNVDPTEFTGLGVFRSLEASLGEVFGNENLEGRTFAIQGIGKIGTEILKLIYPRSEKIFVSDIDLKRLKYVKNKYHKVIVVSPREIYKQSVDVFIPCALGKVINSKNISSMRCKIICGGANNQLENDHTGKLLHKLGVLYAPDYIVNAGGLISVVDEYEHKNNHSRERLHNRIEKIKSNLKLVFEKSRKENKATNLVADEMAKKIFNGNE